MPPKKKTATSSKSRETKPREAKSKETKSKDTKSRETKSKEAKSKETKSKETKSKETKSKETTTTGEKVYMKDAEHAVWEKPNYCFFMKLHKNLHFLLEKAKEKFNDKNLTLLYELYFVATARNSVFKAAKDFNSFHARMAVKHPLSELNEEEKQWVRKLVQDGIAWTTVSRIICTEKTYRGYLTHINKDGELIQPLWKETVKFYHFRVVSYDEFDHTRYGGDWDEVEIGLRAFLVAINRSNDPKPCMQFKKTKHSCCAIFALAFEILSQNLAKNANLERTRGDYIEMPGLEHLRDSDALRVGHTAAKKATPTEEVNMHLFAVVAVMTPVLLGDCISLVDGEARNWRDVKVHKDAGAKEQPIEAIYDAFLIAKSLDCENLINNVRMGQEAFFSDNPGVLTLRAVRHRLVEKKDEDGNSLFTPVTMKGFGTPQKIELLAYHLKQQNRGDTFVHCPYIVKLIREVLHDEEFSKVALPDTGRKIMKLFNKCYEPLVVWSETGKRDHFGKKGKQANAFLTKLVDALERNGVNKTERDFPLDYMFGYSKARGKKSGISQAKNQRDTSSHNSNNGPRLPKRPVPRRGRAEKTDKSDRLEENVEDNFTTFGKPEDNIDELGSDSWVPDTDNTIVYATKSIKALIPALKAALGQMETQLKKTQSTHVASTNLASMTTKKVMDNAIAVYFHKLLFDIAVDKTELQTSCHPEASLKDAFFLLRMAKSGRPQWLNKSQTMLIKCMLEILAVPSLVEINKVPFVASYPSDIDTAMDLVDLALKANPSLLVLHKTQLALFMIGNDWKKVLEHLLRLTARSLYFIGATGEPVVTQETSASTEGAMEMYFGDPAHEDYFSYHTHNPSPPLEDDEAYTMLMVKGGSFLPISLLKLYFRALRYGNYFGPADRALQSLHGKSGHEWSWLAMEKEIVIKTKQEKDWGHKAYRQLSGEKKAFAHYSNALHMEDKLEGGGVIGKDEDNVHHHFGGKFHAEMYCMLGICYQLMYRFDLAIKYFDTALHFDPTYMDAIRRRAQSAMEAATVHMVTKQYRLGQQHLSLALEGFHKYQQLAGPFHVAYKKFLDIDNVIEEYAIAVKKYEMSLDEVGEEDDPR